MKPPPLSGIRHLILDMDGTIYAAVRAAIGRDPDLIIGKPEPGMGEAVLRQHQLTPNQLAIVGDRLHTDLALAHRVGALAVLVLTGKSTTEQAVNAAPAPHLVLSNLGEFRQLLISANES